MSISKTTFVKGEKMNWNKPGGKCPSCSAYDKPKGGWLVLKKSSFGEFLGCNRYPNCKYTTSSFTRNMK